MYLLDTNVLSEARKASTGTASARVLAWLAGVEATQLFISVISVLEIEIGVLSVARRDERQGNILRAWIEQRVLPEFVDRTLPIDVAVARQCARLHVPNRRTERDAMIAATAIVHQMTVVTRNVRDYDGTGVSLVNPW